MMRTLILFTSAVLLVGGAMARAGEGSEERAASERDRRELLTSALDCVRRADELAEHKPAEATQLYREALEHLIEIRASGCRTAALEYNMATLYARLEDPARAITALLRASRLSPRDERIRQNLAFARWLRDGRTTTVSHAADYLDTRSAGEPSDGWRLPALIAWNAAWLLMLIFPGTGRRPGPALFISGLGVILIAAGIATVSAGGNSRSAVDVGVVVDADFLPRKGCGPDYDAAVSFPLPSGSEFRWIETRRANDGERWHRGRFAGGIKAWIPADSAELIE